MKVLTTLLFFVLIIGLAVGAAVFMWFKKPKAPTVDRARIPPPVTAVIVRHTDVPLTIRSQGKLEPVTETRAASEVSGKIMRVSPSFRAGGTFRENDVLLEIDPADYEAALAMAMAESANAGLALKTEAARGAQAERDWKKLGGGKAAGDLVLRRPHQDSAAARVTAADAAVEKAKRDLERTVLRAPYNGRVKTTYTDLASFVAVGTRLADLYATDIYEVRLPVSLENYTQVDFQPGKRGPKVRLYTTIGGKPREWNAVVVRTEGEVNRSDRSIYLVAELPNPDDGILQPGLFVEADIGGKTLTNVVKIPRGALINNRSVLLIDGDNRLRRRDVTVVRKETNEVLLAPDLAEGERICTTVFSEAVAGMEVNVLEKTDEGSGTVSSSAATP